MGTLYAILFALAISLSTQPAWQPTGSIVFFGVVAIQLGVSAFICWHRTALPFATSAMTIGAVVSICLAVLAAIGRPYPTLGTESWVLLAGFFTLAPLFYWIESRVNRTKWRQWKRATERSSIWDRLTLRDIPDLRSDN